MARKPDERSQVYPNAGKQRGNTYVDTAMVSKTDNVLVNIIPALRMDGRSLHFEEFVDVFAGHESVCY